MNEYSLIKQKFINYADGIVLNNKISHAYLIEVDNYDSDLSFVYNFIKMILSNMSFEGVLDEKNNKIFNLIDSNNFPDIFVVSTDTNVIKKNQMLDLKDEYKNKSLYGSKRFYIIKNAEKLNLASANTILKFLEEPEDNIVAFLLTDSRYHVLETILSRCQVLSIKENDYNIDYDDEFIDFLDCILNPYNFFINYKYIVNDYLIEKDNVNEKFFLVEKIIVGYLESIAKNDEFDYNLKLMLSKKNNDYLINLVSIIEDEVPKLSYNVNFKLWLDNVFSKFIGG